MEEKLPIRERLRLRALAARVDADARHLGLDAHTPRPWETGDRVTVSTHQTASQVRAAHAGEQGIVTRLEYMGSYQPGKHPTERWNPAQDDPHADDFTIPIDPEKIAQRERWDRLHDWKVHVRLDSGEDIALWPYDLTSDLQIDSPENDSPDLGL
jgi:hypothetical protein